MTIELGANSRVDTRVHTREEALRRQARLGRMARNGAVDAVLGAVPLVGPVFDLLSKANQANVNLLSAWLEGRS